MTINNIGLYLHILHGAKVVEGHHGQVEPKGVCRGRQVSRGGKEYESVGIITAAIALFVMV